MAKTERQKPSGKNWMAKIDMTIMNRMAKNTQQKPNGKDHTAKTKWEKWNGKNQVVKTKRQKPNSKTRYGHHVGMVVVSCMGKIAQLQLCGMASNIEELANSIVCVLC